MLLLVAAYASYYAASARLKGFRGLSQSPQCLCLGRQTPQIHGAEPAGPCRRDFCWPCWRSFYQCVRINRPRQNR